MSMNQYMHPRNIYKTPPDFKQLAIEFPNFRKHVKQELNGKITLDFKDTEALRALSQTLLLKDFGLVVDIPPNKLIPTIPLRLNYILWIEDLLSISETKGKIVGIDIGTGASCVYSLIAAKNYGWNMFATEIDSQSIEHANKNICNNSLQDNITVKHVHPDTLLKEALEENKCYDFCMLNPPFFSSAQEVHPFFKARKENRPRPRNGFCASTNEVVTKGGEVELVSRLIKESKELGERIRIYTTMIGHKNSLSPLKALLRESDVMSFKQTEFCQGHTTRWGLAWTYCDIDLRKVPQNTLEAIRKQKQKPFTYNIPQNNLSLLEFCSKLKEIFYNLQITYEEIKHNKHEIIYVIIANSNTWSNQRRKRREEQRLKALLNTSNEQDASAVASEIPSKRPFTPDMTDASTKMAEMSVSCSNNCSSKRSLDDSDGDGYYKCKKLKSQIEDCNCNISNFYIKAKALVSTDNSKINIDLFWIEGTANRDSLHQILQYIKNNLK